MLHFSDALFKFVFDPNAIFSIFTPNRSYNSSHSNESSQGQNKWVCLQSLCHFSMDFSTSQTCKKCTIEVQSWSPLFDFKRTKHVVTTVSEWRLFLCSSDGKLAMVLSPNYSLHLRQIFYGRIFSHHSISGGSNFSKCRIAPTMCCCLVTLSCNQVCDMRLLW